jgi:hypothetical protein
MNELSELLIGLQNEAVIALTMVIVSQIKELKIFKEVKTKFISIIVAIILVLLMNFLVISDELILNIELIATIILPSLGYDYIVSPFYQSIVKPFLDLFKE